MRNFDLILFLRVTASILHIQMLHVISFSDVTLWIILMSTVDTTQCCPNALNCGWTRLCPREADISSERLNTHTEYFEGRHLLLRSSNWMRHMLSVTSDSIINHHVSHLHLKPTSAAMKYIFTASLTDQPRIKKAPSTLPTLVQTCAAET